MGFPWGKLAKFGLGVGAKFVPMLGVGVGLVEILTDNKKKTDPTFTPNATEREDQAVLIALGVLQITEGLSGKDLLNNAAAMDVVRRVIRLEVAAENMKAALEQGREELAALVTSLKAIRPPNATDP